jgi:molybdopterin molybdotransferase
MLDYASALSQLLTHMEVLRADAPRAMMHTPLFDAVGLALAHDVLAQHDMPLFDNSAMDGYALHLHTNTPIDGLIDASFEAPYELVGRIAAGQDAAQIQLYAGQAARIFTGAPLPAGANAVVAQECVQVVDNQIVCTSAVMIGQHIRLRGEDVRAGDVLLQAPQLLRPAAIGLAASQGYANLPTFAPLRVTVFSSGNELIEPNQTLHAGQIFDANRHQMLGWLRSLHCVVMDGGILPDAPAATESALRTAAANSDVILTSGGVSVGEEDHLKAALEAAGTLTQWKLAIKPGKPFAWGQIERATVLMLPGNPVATFVTFKLLVEPALKTLQGYVAAQAMPRMSRARADFAQTRLEPRREFLRGVLRTDADGEFWVSRLPNQGSHMLSACVAANVLIDVLPNTPIAHGDALTIYPIE